MKQRLLSLLLALVLVVSALPITAAAQEAPLTGTVQVDDSLNVRSGPGTGNPIVGSLYNGDVVTILATDTSTGSQWYHIQKDALTGYVSAAYVLINTAPPTYETEEAFEAYLTAQGFPEDYKPALRQLHAQYPGWIFKANHLPMTFATAVEKENRPGINVIQRPEAWLSMDYGNYNWTKNTYVEQDSGGWKTVKPAVIAYYMDPRNWLDSTYIFQFEELSYNPEHTADGVRALLPTALDKYADDVVKAAKESGVSAYHLATRMTQEGSHLNGLGTGTVPGYEGYYNFFHWGTYQTESNGVITSAVTNGAIYAKNHGWNTPYKCLVDSANSLGKGYIKLGQDTGYYQKFNVVNTTSGLYSHQYMTNVQAAASEASIRRREATAEELQTRITFDIPVYKEMPATVAPRPGETGNNNHFLDNLTVPGYTLTPSFDRYTTDYSLHVAGDVSSIDLQAVLSNSGATLQGAGKQTVIPGTTVLPITVTATSGDTRTYTVTVTRVGEGTTYPDGLNQIEGQWYYCRNGKVDFTYTGLCYHNGIWYYVENGKVNTEAETLCLYDGMWFYVKGGTVAWDATTLVPYMGDLFYVQDGMVNWETTTLFQYQNVWYYVKNGKVDRETVTLVFYSDMWFYVKNGQVDWDAETLCEYNGSFFYVQGGMVAWEYTGPFTQGGVTYRIEGGILVKSTPAAPPAPQLVSRTDTSVTLQMVEGYEYAVKGGPWQKSPVFTGLAPATGYTFIQRVAETAATYTGPAGPGLSVTTDKTKPAAPPAPTVAFKTADSVTLVAVTGYEYRMDDGPWQSSPVFAGLKPHSAHSFTQRVAETATAYASPISPALDIITQYPDGLNRINGELVYYRDGEVDTTYIGLCQYEGVWYYVKNGKVDRNAETLVFYNDTWFYVKNGQIDWVTETLCPFGDDLFYVRGGVVAWDVTTLVMHQNIWYYVQGGKVEKTAETLVFYNNLWFYVKGGQIDWVTETLVPYNDGLFHVRGGMVAWDVTTLVMYQNIWYYVQGGMVNRQANTLCFYNNMWFYVKGGTVAWDATTLVPYNGSLFYVRGGMVDWLYSGTVWYNGRNYRVTNGIANN